MKSVRQLPKRRQALATAVVIACSGSPGSGAKVAIAPWPGDPSVHLVVFRTDEPIGWDDAHRLVEIAGVSWSVPTDEASRAFVAEVVGTLGPWECVGPWIGVLRSGGRSAITDGWISIATGREVFSPPWSSDAPLGAAPLRWAVALDGRDGAGLETWIELLPDAEAGPGSFGLVAITPADTTDCDGDGIPDAIEIHWLGTEPCDPSCPADLDGNDRVDGADLGAWLSSVGDDCPPGVSCPGDLDGDGAISGADLGLLLAAWGPCG
jgi:hypothetical protein